MTTLKDLAVKHDYYCEPRSVGYYDTWKDFYLVFKDMDIDLDLIFRWDIQEDDDGSFSMDVFMMQQRKGHYMSKVIRNVDEEDVPAILDLMGRHWARLQSIWTPISTMNHP